MGVLGYAILHCDNCAYDKDACMVAWIQEKEAKTGIVKFILE